MDLITNYTNSRADAVRISLGEKDKADHIAKLRRQKDEAKKKKVQNVS